MPSTGTTPTPPDSAPDRWVDALLLRLHAIFAGRWEKHIESVPYPALKAEWSRALAGLTGQQIAAGLDACRQVRTWPPVPAEFRADCLGGMNAEQRAYQARAETPPAALTQGTYADTRDAGAQRIAGVMSALKGHGVTRTDAGTLSTCFIS